MGWQVSGSEMNMIVRKRLLQLTAFLLPVAYLGQLFAVAVHEIVGHGLAAILIGGRFCGFQLNWDAMGWAYAFVPPDASIAQRVAHLAAGTLATTAGGVLLLGAAMLRRLPLPLQLVAIVFGLCCLLEGPPYILWNSYHPVPPGDIARILSLLSQGRGSIEPVRWLLIVCATAVCVVSTVVGFTMLVRRIQGSLWSDATLSASERAGLVLLFAAVPGSLAWLLFDWNQIAPGIGRLPQAVGILLCCMTAGLLYIRPVRPIVVPAGNVTLVMCAAIAWLMLGLSAMLTVMIFPHGVSW